MNFIDESLSDYVNQHSDKESDLLKALDRETNLKINLPRMISGHYQGRLLSMISKMINPNMILEIGTFTGYSAICLAEGLTENGKLITIDINEELSDLTSKYFSLCNNAHQIQSLFGNALEIIPTLDFEFDLVFIDADKKNNANYYQIVLPRLRKGGFILVDNVLWSGKVILKPDNKIDKDTQNILDFNQLIAQDTRIEKVILPIRDGITLIRKK